MTEATHENPNLPSARPPGSERFNILFHGFLGGIFAGVCFTTRGDAWVVLFSAISSVMMLMIALGSMLSTPNAELSGGGPLSNETTEAESRRPME